MNIDSVRALKAELAETVIRPMVAEAFKAGRFGVAARSASSVRRRAVRGLALGITKAARRNYRLAVRLQRRALEEDAELRARVEDAAKGETEIRYIGRITKQQAPWSQRLQRPLLVGSSVSHANVTAGTLGGFLHHRPSGATVIVSNNHVLANEDRCAQGDPVRQPGVHDGGLGLIVSASCGTGCR